MAVKNEKTQNCVETEDAKDGLEARANNEDCQLSFSKPMGSLICSSLDVMEEKLKSTKDFGSCDSLNEMQNLGEIKYKKERFATEDHEEKSQNPACQLRRSPTITSTLALKDEKFSIKEESGSCQSPLSYKGSQKSTNLSPSPSKYSFCDDEELQTSFSSNKDYASPPAPSKQKLRSTKRRAGILYKQLINSKLCKVTSKYFSQAHNNNKKRWIPPRSPYALVQEDLFDNPWQLLVATIFLTKTTAKKALPQLHKFLACYPRPEDVLKANYEDIDDYFKPLGLTTTRSHIIMRFTVEYLEKDWTYPRELYGIGKYGDDSYRMFCINEWRQVSPDDIPLTMYRNWLLENAEHLGID